MAIVSSVTLVNILEFPSEWCVFRNGGRGGGGYGPINLCHSDRNSNIATYVSAGPGGGTIVLVVL